MAVHALPSNPFSSIEALANREIARRIVAQVRNSNSPDRYETAERLIAAALDDAQTLGRVAGAVRCAR
jgi:hypothetical protein